MKVHIGKPGLKKVICKVDIQEYDTFSLYSPLANIIWQAIQKYKTTIKNKDFLKYPLSICGTSDAEKKLLLNMSEEGIDAYYIEKWHTMLDEMIWGFKEIAEEFPEENKFFVGFDP